LFYRSRSRVFMKPVHLESFYNIRASREEIYQIITDFENLPEYFPAVAKSARLISRDGNNFVVEVQTKAFFGSRTFHVRMEGQLRPPEGFVSTNVSSLGIEHEIFMMEEISEGTKIHYVNDVEIKSPFFRIFGGFLIKKVALRYWESVVFSKLKQMLEK
jgi:carbon monoxide dehydrogenase subunit G